MPRFNGIPVDAGSTMSTDPSAATGPRFAGIPADGSNNLSPDQQQMLQGGYGAVNSGAGGFINGLPVVGPYLKAGADRVSAGISSLIDGQSYDDNLKRVQGVVQQAKTDHPYLNVAGNIGGGVAGTAAMAAVAPEAFGVGSGPILGRSLASMGSSAIVGGTDSAVRSDGDLRSTAIGAGVGGVLGAAAPVLGKAIGAGVRYFTTPTDSLSGLSRGAVNYATDQLSDPAKIAAQQAALQRLGPDAMLADVSKEWEGVALGASTRPGVRETVINPLQARSDLANQRLLGDLDSSLGPAIVPSQEQAAIRQSMDTVREGYAPVMATARAVDTQPLADNLDAMTANLRGPAQQAVQRVRGYLNIPGTDTLDPNPQALLSTRHAIDGLMATETNPQVIGQLTEARRAVDGILTTSAPGIKDVDASFAELARQRDALGQGRAILSNEVGAMRPQELQQTLQEGALPQGQQMGPSAVPLRLQQAARADIDRAVGTQANDVTALRKIVRGEGDWNRTKLGMLFTPDNASTALNAIDREATFGNTANTVIGNSNTGVRQGFGKFLDEVAQPHDIPKDVTAMGLGLNAVKKLSNAILQGNASANASKYANELGGLSVAQGTTRDQLINALMARAQQGPSSLDPRTQALISAMMQTGGQQALR